jgi:hypothetical protein
MNSDPQTPTTANGLIWTGRVLSAVAALFLLFGGVMDLLKPASVVEAIKQFGYPENVIVPLGIAVIACTLIYLIPRTSVLGAILLSGYLGGAVATHVRAGQGWGEILFPVVFAAIVWGGLWLREPRLRGLIISRR